MVQASPPGAKSESKTPPDDPAQQYIKRARQFVWAYKKPLVAAAATLCCVILVTGGLFYFLNRAENAASARLLEIMRQYRHIEEKSAPAAYADIKKNFKSLIEDYGYTDAGKMALLQYARLCHRTGDLDRALALYQSAWKEFKGNPRFDDLVLYGMAHVYAEKGDNEKAAEYFQRVVDNSGTALDDLALFNLGLVHERAGNTEKSRQAFEKIVSDYSDSIYAQVAKARLSG